MTLILIALVVSAIISGALLAYSEGSDGKHWLAGLLGLLGCFAVIVGLGLYVTMGWYWLAAEHKTTILNREYGTHYTQTEIFYASDVIDTIRNLDRTRYEINGNLLGDKSAK